MSYDTALVWLRSDLRVLDNPALHSATEQSKRVMAVYLRPTRQWQRHGTACIQQDLICRQLQALKRELAEFNIPLLIVNADDFQGQIDALIAICTQYQVDALYANKELEVNEQSRDAEIQSRLPLPQHWFDESCYFPPGSLLNGKGEPYRVFTPFSKAWKERLLKEGCHCLGKPKTVLPWPEVDPEQTEGSFHFNYQNESKAYGVGTEHVLTRLRDFASTKLSAYKRQRDFPAIDGTSQLSPYLAIGALSVRQCVTRLWYEAESQGFGEGAQTWLNELIWRDFYKHVMVAWPQVQKGDCFNSDYESLAWENRQDWFDAWCAGQTGFPIVDAAMRQLNATGWMHNRLRMIVACFLTKDLLIDWRWGERYFMSKLIDGDLSANNGGWQWASSTGTDAAPYFRIFNPVTQSQRFDPNGDFIRTYVHELAAVTTKQIHLPGDGERYLQAKVDHKVQRQKALDLYQQARSDSGK